MGNYQQFTKTEPSRLVVTIDNLLLIYDTIGRYMCSCYNVPSILMVMGFWLGNYTQQYVAIHDKAILVYLLVTTMTSM